MATSSFIGLKQSRETMETLLLCLKAVSMAIDQNFDTQWSFAKDYALLRQLSQAFEDGFYL
mgnify:CR=1 FL=1